MDEVQRLYDTVERVDRFPGVDQMHAFVDDLAARYPDRVAVEPIGRSRGGDQIQDVRVGSGPNHVIVIGGPHPNEPIGLLTIQHLLRQLCAEDDLLARMAATWHFVPCVDPDGTRLNEGWYAGPITREHVARHMYRPPIDEQPEWTFPATWRGTGFGSPIPETQALMTLIDRTEPALIASLHNGDFGGGFFYVAGGDPTYFTALTQLLADADIPPHLSEPDAPGARPLHPGVFELPTIEQLCDTMAAAGADPLSFFPGGCSRDYSSPYGTAFLVCELPLWTDPRSADATPGDQTLREVALAAAVAYRDVHDRVAGILDRVSSQLSGHSPVQRALTEGLPTVLAMAQAKEATATDDRTATNAEIFLDQLAFPSMLRLRVGGMLLRLLSDEAAPVFARERAEFAPVFDEWCAEVRATAPGDLVPLDRLVAVQSAAIGLAVTRIRDGLPI